MASGGHGQLEAAARRIGVVRPGQRLALQQQRLGAQVLPADGLCRLDRLAGQAARHVVLALHEGPVGADRQQLHLARRVEAVLRCASPRSGRSARHGRRCGPAATRGRASTSKRSSASSSATRSWAFASRSPASSGRTPKRRAGRRAGTTRLPRGPWPAQVLGDDRGVLLGACDGLAGLDEPPGRAAVVAFALRTQDAVVRHVPQQGVLEQELPGRREPRHLALQHDLALPQGVQRAGGGPREPPDRRGGPTARSQKTRPTTAARCSTARSAALRASRRDCSTPRRVEGTATEPTSSSTTNQCGSASPRPPRRPAR